MKTRSETIVLVGMPTRKEDRAIAAVSPGHVVVYSGAGIIKRATAAVQGAKAIVFENELLGKTILDAYAIGENVYYGVFKAGDRAQVRVPAGAAAIIKGDSLEFDATGCFRKLASGVAVAIANEALNNSAGGAEAFLTVEFL